MRSIKFRFYFLPLLVLGFLFFLSPLQAQTISEEKEVELAKDTATEINVKNADIESLIRIFSKKTKRNYILDERVKGTVSIYLPGKISSEEAIYILDSVLALKGFTTVPIGDNLWKIIPAQEAKQTTVPIVEAGTGRGTASVVTRFITLKYVSADDVKQLISSLISTYGLVSAYTGTNSLILIDSEDNINRLVKIIENLDVPSSDAEMTIIPIEFAEAADVAEKLKEILTPEESKSGSITTSGGDIPQVSQTQVKGKAAAAKASLAATEAAAYTVSSLARQPKIIADERTNSLIIVADEETTARIKALVDQLDSKLDRSGSRFYVYRCQNADAEQLAEVLGGLTGSGGSSSSSSSSKSSSSSFGSNDDDSSSLSSSRNRSSADRNSSQQRTPGRSRSENKSAGSGVSSVQFGEDLSITSDPATNSLIINGSFSDYQKILELLAKLDIKRRQVVVEALIMEVVMKENLELGSEFMTSLGGSDGGMLFSNTQGDLAQLFKDPASLQDFTMAAASAGTLTLPGGVKVPTHSALIRATQGNGNLNILSAPTILATDNEDAEIVVGQNVPFLASTATSQADLNNTFNQIDRQDVGITLRITPQISSSENVTLKIFTEVSALDDSTTQSNLGPTTTIRTSDTVAIAKDGQMVVIGGLMADITTHSRIGIPFLKDIPVLGYAFGTETENTERRNLLIFLTPRIVKDQFDARDYTKKQADGMSEVIEKYEMFPDRHDELNSPDMDNVIEGKIYNGTKPGTLVGKEKEPVILEVPAGGSDSAPTSEGEISLQLGEAKDSMAAVKSETQKNQVDFGRYLVLELRSEAKEPFPQFLQLPKSRLAAIYITPDTDTTVKEYFSVGNVYTYKSAEGDFDMQAVGVFYSEQEAKSFYPELENSWYRLTPHEILNLGKGPWLKKE